MLGTLLFLQNSHVQLATVLFFPMKYFETGVARTNLFFFNSQERDPQSWISSHPAFRLCFHIFFAPTFILLPFPYPLSFPLVSSVRRLSTPPRTRPPLPLPVLLPLTLLLKHTFSLCSLFAPCFFSALSFWSLCFPPLIILTMTGTVLPSLIPQLVQPGTSSDHSSFTCDVHVTFAATRTVGILSLCHFLGHSVFISH